MRGLKLRAVIYPLLFIPLITVAVMAVMLCLRAGEVPRSLLNSRIGGWFANRYGVQYSLRSLNVGCFRAGCRTQVDAGGVAFTLRDVPEINVNIGSVHWCPAEPVSAGGVRFADLSIGNVDVSQTTGAAEVRDIRFNRESIGSVAIRQVSASAPRISGDHRLTFDRVDVSGIDVRLTRSTTAPDLCVQTRSLLAASDALAALVQRTRGVLERSIAQIRHDLLVLSIILASILFLLKWLLTGWIARWFVRLSLAAGAVAVPILLYNSIRVAFGASLLFAVAAWLLQYRRASHGYQRWEPFALDIACFAIALPMAASHFDPGPPIQPPASLGIAVVNITDTTISGNADSCGTERAIRATAGSLVVADVNLSLPKAPNQTTEVRVGRIQAPSTLIEAGDLRIPNLQLTAGNLHFSVDGRTRQIQDLRTTFRAGAAVEGAAVEPIRFDVDEAEIAFDPSRCGFNFSASALVSTKPVRANMVVAGNTETIRLRSFRTMPGSVFQIAAGSGTVALTKSVLAKLQLAGFETTIGASRVKIASTTLSAGLPLPCSTGSQTLQFAANGAEVSSGGSNVRVAQTDVAFRREPDTTTTLTTKLSDTRFDVPLPLVAGNIPKFQLTASGVTRGQRLPESFTGELEFSTTTASGGLKFSTSFADRRLTIPLQDQVFQQTVFPGLPQDIPVRLSASSGFGSPLEAFVLVRQLALPVGPLQAELNGLALSVSGQAIDLKSEWNSITLPSFPSSFCLERISQLDLSTTGEVSELHFPGFSSGRLAEMPCAEIPRLPSKEEFRIEGSPSSLRFERREGKGFAVRDLRNILKRIDLPDGRLNLLELDSEATVGAIGSRSQLVISDGGIRVSAKLFDGNRELFDGVLENTLGQVGQVGRVGQADRVGQVHLNGTSPRGSLTADAWFEGTELARLKAVFDIASGQFASNPMLNVSVGNSKLAVDLERDNLIVNADVSSLNLDGRRTDGTVFRADAGLRASLNGRLYRSGRPAPNPIFNSASTAVSSLSRRIPAAPSNLKWKLQLRNSSDAPFLQIRNDVVAGRIAGEVDMEALTGSFGFDGDFKLHNNQLVADAYAPLKLSSPINIDLKLPLLVVFSDRLKSAQTLGSLWDSVYYEQFWSTYRAGESTRGVASLINESRVVAGPISIRQLEAPLEPLRFAIGYSDGLDVHVPFSARLMYGSANGTFDAAMTWPTDRISLNSRLNLGFRNVQASGVGLDSGSGQTPFLEHELDGDVSASAEGWPLLADNLSFSVNVRSSNRNGATPGVFQLRTGTQVRTLNKLLDWIALDLQLKNPPSSVFFRNMSLNFDVDKGKVRTDHPWLQLEGLRILSSDNLNLEGNIRLHGARNGEILQLRNLLGNIQMLRQPND